MVSSTRNDHAGGAWRGLWTTRGARWAQSAIIDGMGDSPLTAMDAAQRRAHELARRQGGVVRVAQLIDLGIPPRTIRRWVAAGIWVRHGRTVLSLPGVGHGLKVRSLIVAQRLGPASCLTGASALAVRDQTAVAPWDALPEAVQPWVIHPHQANVSARVLRRWPEGGRMVLGVRVAEPTTVMLDLLRFLPELDARNLAYRASGTYAWAGFMRGLAGTAEKHRHAPGVGQLRAIADLVSTGARSEAELLVHDLLNRAEITGWKPNYPVRIKGQRYYLDIAFPAARLALEIDGRAYHDDSKFTADRKRHNKLEVAGWKVLHLTWDRLVHEPEEVVREIREALAVAGRAS